MRFEEYREDHGLCFRYQWAQSDRFGFIRTASVENCSAEPVTIDIIDGLRNLMPANAQPTLQRGSSCLINAYTRCDVDVQTKLATISLSALIVDQPKPAQSLLATVAWCAGLRSFDVLLSTRQVPKFRRRRRRASRASAQRMPGKLPHLDKTAAGARRNPELADRSRRERGTRRGRESSFLAPRWRGIGITNRSGDRAEHRQARKKRGIGRWIAVWRGRNRGHSSLRQRPVQQHARRRLRRSLCSAGAGFR